jgi:phage baseplate assembly protein W
MATTVVSSITPTSANVGDPGFTMTIRGTGFTNNSILQFGGQQMSTTYMDTTQLSATIPSSAFPTASLGGLSVNVSDSGQLSNSTTFTVQNSSPVSLNDLQNLANNITMPSTTSLITESNPYIIPINSVNVYRVTQGDLYQGLQGIAQDQMGDATDWQQIAFINNLRYPYLSEDELELEGNNATTLYLSSPVTPGNTTIYVSGVSPFLIAGTILFFSLQSPQTDGTVQTLSDVVRIQSVQIDSTSPASTRVLLQQPIYNTYPIGTSFNVLDTSNNTSSRVVTIGDFILIPSGSGSNNNIQGNNLDITQLYALLGQDIWLDNNGLIRNDQNGDLQTVVGVPNLKQAVTHRMRTEIGELVYHQDYGDPLLAYVGKVNSSVLAILANQKLSASLLDDPRIAAVQNIVSTSQGDVLIVTAKLLVNLFNASTNLSFEIPAS